MCIFTMSVEVLPAVPLSSARRKMGTRTLFRCILAAGVICVIGWYLVSRSLLFSGTKSPNSHGSGYTEDPLITGIEQEIKARKLDIGGVRNLFPVDPESKKLVLFWTNFFGTPDGRRNLGTKLFEGCPVHLCSAISEKNRLAESDAVIFHALDIDPLNLPGPRRTGQHYVFHIGESPANVVSRIEKTPDDFFDMTFTYKLDSDILGHYIYNVPLEKKPKNFAKGKTKLIAWFVSNCKTPSGRENFVQKLQKKISVDVFGKCGPLKCPRNNEAACNEMLRKDYKFYLAFENSICQDYVTEKFTTPLHNGVVPVYLGGGNMSIFPPKSFISVDDFSSVEKLADFLTFLDKNDTAYNEFMEWRFDPKLVKSHGRFSPAESGWCQLCQHLHDPSFVAKNYPDARKWFMDGGNCRSGSW